jgi:hypothetical protein
MAEKSAGVEGERSVSGRAVARPAADVVARRLGDSAVLIRLTTNRIYELNATGARVWELVQQGMSRDEVVDRLTQEFGAAFSVIAADVDDLLRMLRDEGLTVE